MATPRSKRREAACELGQADEMLELFNELMERVASVNSTPKEFDTGMTLHRSEIHTVQAIGLNQGANIVGLARHLGVTKGAVSQMITKLEKKGLVGKRAAPDDGRGVVIGLTPLGWTGFRAHQRFHSEMLSAVREHLHANPSSRLAAIQDALRDLIGIVQTYERRTARR